MNGQPPSFSPAAAQAPSRRRFLAGASRTAILGGLFSALASSGCVPRGKSGRQPSLVWGRKGLSEGRLMKPRAMVFSPSDELYIVDITGRIQVFDRDGEYLRGWRTPEIKQGKPTGLGFGIDGNLLVPDTHYYRVLVYSPEGVLDESRTIGGVNGDGPGEFHFVTDVAQDSRGHIFAGQYGQIDRIQEFDPSGGFVRMWGTQGSAVGEFSRPQCVTVDPEGLLWIADACNHRIQVYDVSLGGKPELVDCWGTAGTGRGKLQYPYGLVFDRDGSVLIAEYGNHRIQRFDRRGASLEMWGVAGTDAGQFMSPWALALDSQRSLHVLDTLNHRVQRFDLG